jgi:hypothetical protein
MDIFGWTIVIIFCTTLVISLFKSSVKDRCIKALHGTHTITLFQNGKSLFGKLHLEATGYTTLYDRPYSNGGHLESGFILYKSEFPTLFGVFRPIEDLTSNEQGKRKTQYLMVKQPFIVILRNRTRNFFAAFRDAIVQSLTLFMGRLVSKTSVVGQNQKYITDAGTSVVDYVWNSYDPLLERNLGKPVIYEVFRNGTWEEYSGILVRYTKDFILVFDSSYPLDVQFRIRDQECCSTHLGVSYERNGPNMTVWNQRNQTVWWQNQFNLSPGEKWEGTVEKDGPIDCSIALMEPMDIAFPRSVCIVRHPSEPKDSNSPKARI